MYKELSEKIYNQEDIAKAFDMGFEAAIIFLEDTIGLTSSTQYKILEKLKEDRFKY